MRELSLTDVYFTKFKSENVYGEQVGGYTGLIKARVNVQYMSNDIEFQTYGEITNSIITIRSNDIIKGLEKGDYLYLTKPTAKRSFTIDGKTYNDYGIGEYQIESIKPAYIGAKVVHNRTYITARRIKNV